MIYENQNDDMLNKERYRMQFKDLEWKDVITDNVIVCSHCEINIICIRLVKAVSGGCNLKHMIQWNQQRMQHTGFIVKR